MASIGEQYAGSQVSVVSMFRGPAVHLSQQRSGDAAARTWLYDFAYHSEVDGLSAHCVELPFVWDLLGAEGVARVLGDPPQRLADTVHADWVAFTASGRMPWPTVAEDPCGAMVFDVDSAFAPDAYRLEAALYARP